MKKLILLLALVFTGFTTVFGQGVKLGINAGLPVGDISDASNFQVGADVSYLYPATDMFSLGGLIGYSHFFMEDIDLPGVPDRTDASFLPIAASARFGFSDFLFVGGDLGYAVGLSDGNDGGFYYRPKVGYGLGKLAIIASFAGISVDGGDVSSVNLGIEFGF